MESAGASAIGRFLFACTNERPPRVSQPYLSTIEIASRIVVGKNFRILWTVILGLPSVSRLCTRRLDTNDVSMTQSLQRVSSSSKQQFSQTLSHKTGSTGLP
jgi:hypothetical protein